MWTTTCRGHVASLLLNDPSQSVSGISTAPARWEHRWVCRKGQRWRCHRVWLSRTCRHQPRSQSRCWHVQKVPAGSVLLLRPRWMLQTKENVMTSGLAQCGGDQWRVVGDRWQSFGGQRWLRYRPTWQSDQYGLGTQSKKRNIGVCFVVWRPRSTMRHCPPI